MATATESTPTPEYTSAALQARELEWAKNSPELEQAHAAANQGIVRTRFPPGTYLQTPMAFTSAFLLDLIRSYGLSAQLRIHCDPIATSEVSLN